VERLAAPITREAHGAASRHYGGVIAGQTLTPAWLADGHAAEAFAFFVYGG
jgi:hypothetical protein